MAGTNRANSNGHWATGTKAIATYVVIITTGLNQGLDRVVFPVRHDPFTGTMHKSYSEKIDARFKKIEEQQISDRDYLREYSDDNRKHQEELLNKESLRVRLYITENFLDKNTPIPPPEVVSRLNRIERLHDRHEDQIDDIRQKIAECCYNHKADFKALEAQ